MWGRKGWKVANEGGGGGAAICRAMRRGHRRCAAAAKPYQGSSGGLFHSQPVLVSFTRYSVFFPLSFPMMRMPLLRSVYRG